MASRRIRKRANLMFAPLPRLRSAKKPAVAGQSRADPHVVNENDLSIRKLQSVVMYALIFSPLHSITSSARASTDGGTVRPSVFAALRLITSSYLVGFCTGMSAGLAPLRMRST